MSKKSYLIAILAVLAAFLIWRIIRPMNIFMVDERFERPIQVEVPRGLKSVSAQECGTCHIDIYREWSASMHGNAWAEPYFQVDYRFDGSQQICLNCHTPLVNQQQNLVLGFKDRDKFDPILAPNPEYSAVLRDEGVTCAVCHVRNGVITGPYKTDKAPHPVEYDPEMSGGIKPCLRCHVVPGKRWDTFYSIPPCGTVAEIQKAGSQIDCVGCHMPTVKRPGTSVVTAIREGRVHLWQGGHTPEQVKKSLSVEYRREAGAFVFILTNKGAAHYIPTGTPDRHLTLEVVLLDATGEELKKEEYTMKRYILWRPFIVDVRDTRLPYGQPREFRFAFSDERAAALDVTVQYHLLDEARRRRIGYENTEPIFYPVYHQRIPL